MSGHPQSIKKVFADTLLSNSAHKQHGIAVSVTLLLTQLWCRIQNDCYRLPRHLKTLCFSWSWGAGRKIKLCWMETCVGLYCETDHCNGILQWNSIFLGRGWELQAFCVELRAYKMEECHTASFLPACAWFAFPASWSNVIPRSSFGFMGHPHFLREELVLKYCYLCSAWVCAVQLMLIMELYWRIGTFSKKKAPK